VTRMPFLLLALLTRHPFAQEPGEALRAGLVKLSEREPLEAVYGPTGSFQ
jgi:hypothetical protein